MTADQMDMTTVGTGIPVGQSQLAGTNFGGVTTYDPRFRAYKGYGLALRSLMHLERLGDNWDTYGSQKVQPLPIAVAMDVLGTCVASGIPMPEFAPIPGGGIGLDWTLNNVDYEMGLLPDGDIECVETQADGRQKEIHFKFVPYMSWLGTLSPTHHLANLAWQ
jgi:hypothetical protein